MSHQLTFHSLEGEWVRQLNYTVGGRLSERWWTLEVAGAVAAVLFLAALVAYIGAKIVDWEVGYAVESELVEKLDGFAPFDQAYWERAYADDAEPFDWYTDWVVLESIVRDHTRPYDALLYVGCGTSSLPRRLRAIGHQCVLSTDNVQAAVSSSAALVERDGAYAGLAYAVMDARKLQCRDSAFDAVLDKGMLDGISCAPRTGAARLAIVLRELHRVLRPGGILIVVSTYSRELARESYVDTPLSKELFICTRQLSFSSSCPSAARRSEEGPLFDEESSDSVGGGPLSTSSEEEEGAAVGEDWRAGRDRRSAGGAATAAVGAPRDPVDIETEVLVLVRRELS
jgi:SAM-dependent methyltransferase